MRQNIANSIKENRVPKNLVIGQSLFIIGHDFIFEQIFEFGSLFRDVYKSIDNIHKTDKAIKPTINRIGVINNSIMRANKENLFK